MAFEITYNKLIEVAIWQHTVLKTDAFDPAALTYTGATTSFVLPLSTLVPDSVLPQLLKYDLRDQIRIQPSPDTTDQLKQLGLTFRQTTTGFFIAKKENTTLPTNTNLRFSFYITSIDGDFVEKTKITTSPPPEGWPAAQIFHLSNANHPASSRFLLSRAAGNIEVLHPEHFYTRQGRVVRLAQSSPGQATTIEVFDDLAAPSDPAIKTFTFPAINGQAEYELDCRSFPEGRYRFESSNITNITLYLGLENRPNLLGVIDIFPIGWEGSFYDIRLAENTS